MSLVGSSPFPFLGPLMPYSDYGVREHGGAGTSFDPASPDYGQTYYTGSYADKGGAGTSFDPASPDYGQTYYTGAYAYRDSNSPYQLFKNWKYLLSGNWIGAGLDDFVNNVLPDVNERLEQTLDQGGTDDVFGNPNTSGSIPRNPVSPETLQYLNAELAKFYGMDRNTAYQEALSNTAYQRAVADMQRAGLNPAAIFGAGRGNTAGGVAFIGNTNSAIGFGKSNSKLFESDTYGMIAALSGLATALATKKPQNFWLGQQAAQGVMQTMNVIDRKFSK